MAKRCALLHKNKGIDQTVSRGIVNGNVFESPIYDTYGTLIAEGRYSPAGFRLALGLKDMRLVLGAADAEPASRSAWRASFATTSVSAVSARKSAILDSRTALAQVIAENAGSQIVGKG